MEAAHAPDQAFKGIGTKSRDQYAIPLSERCHKRQHAIGWPRFALTFLQAEPRALADAYWRAWPGRRSWVEKNFPSEIKDVR